MSRPAVSRGISARVMPRSLLVAEQAVRVVQAERQADHGRDRRQRDVALVEVQAHAEHAARRSSRPCRRCRSRESRSRRNRRSGRSGRSRGFRGRRPGAAGSGSSVPRCRSAAAVRPGPASSARRRSSSASPTPRPASGSRVNARSAEKPRPPYSFGMIMPKNLFFFRYSQISGGRSARTWVISQSLVMRQTSSHRAVEEGLLFGGQFRLGLAEQHAPSPGLPENSSPSKPTVPASSATFSVSDSGGRILRVETSAAAR